MGEFNYSGVVAYDSTTGNFVAQFVHNGNISEDLTPDLGPSPGTINDIFEVGEETIDSGVDFNEIYVGTAVVDGVTMIVLSDAARDLTYFVVPVSVEFSSITWPANSSGITTDPVPTAFCFAQGTRIASPGHDMAVEDLQIGDEIVTACGRAVPVKWIGRQTLHKLFSGPHMQPVRIRAGALGAGVPHSDLTVTADHGMVIDGLVINASALVNGHSIAWAPMADLPDEVTYYHVETEEHDVILANGAPAETFIDYAGRKAFDNHAEYLALYGAERIIREMDRPRISAARLVPAAIRARLGMAVADSFATAEAAQYGVVGVI